MKNFIMAIVLVFSVMFAATPVMAEASFDQIQTLIQKQEYRAAEKGLEEIIHNHPNSAKAFYAMAQAQAGLGNLTKAQHALDKAMGLNPELNFAPKSSVENLKQAIHPQVAKIEVIEESHILRNMFIVFVLLCVAGTAWHFYDKIEKQKKRQKILEEEAETLRKKRYEESIERMQKFEKERLETRKKEKAAGINVEKVTKPEPAKDQKIYAGGSPNIPKPVAVTPVAPTPVQHAPVAPVVVNNTTSNNSVTDFMLGAAMGHILTANSHKETVREREVIREVEKPQESPKSSSWDDSPSVSTRSSSWDDSSSSSRSSSWDSDSSSSRSSSWSSSSDNSSSSSWDSGSSDSGSSSWD